MSALDSGMDDETAELLTGSLREMFRSAPPDLGAALDELGWDEVAAEDPARATTMLFVEHGRSLTTSALLDRVMLADLPVSDTRRAVLHSLDSMDVLLTDPAAVDEILVPLDTSFAVVPAGQVSDTAPLGGFGADTGWFSVDAIDAAGAPQIGDEALVRQSIAAGRRVLTAEIIGVCEAAVALAIAHTTARVQYGRAIGSFQAVRHRVAESHVAVVAAREVLAVAWETGGEWEAALAKARAGRAQAEVMRNVIQFFGAMGVSMESVVHRHVTRAGSLDLLLGSHLELAEQLGRELLAGADFLPVARI